MMKRDDGNNDDCDNADDDDDEDDDDDDDDDNDDDNTTPNQGNVTNDSIYQSQLQNSQNVIFNPAISSSCQRLTSCLSLSPYWLVSIFVVTKILPSGL